MAVKDYSTNPDENITISGINIGEGCPPSGINNAIRQFMADVKVEYDNQAETNKSLEESASAIMVGATSEEDGKAGKAPAPSMGEQNKPLTGGGKYADSLDCDITGNAATATKLQGGAGNLAMPVGAIYVQFSGQVAPSDLFGGTWSNISSSYSGLFFRAEGWPAAAFGNTQEDSAPNIIATASHIETYKNRSTSGAFEYTYAINNNNISTGDSFGSSTLTFDASKYSNKYVTGSEVRPINSTVRIWKRTA